jgi:single-strand DNA-binding protein
MLKVEGIGRLVADPELRYTPTGRAVGSFRLACDVAKDETEFIQIIVWEKMAEIVCNHLTKGRLVYVEGRLQQREYDRQDGTKGKITEVVAKEIKFLDYAKKEEVPLPEEPASKKK